ncbi:MAG: hypothetical protein J6Y08_08300 [Clostridiales bacterium]|nr:hypothetical protein [Clostridiales bacterium]
MSGILEAIAKEENWQAFLQYKLDGRYVSRKEREALISYVDEKRYLPIAEKLLRREYCFGLPDKRTINKSGTTKKRVIYTFSEDENLFLKGLVFLLYRYDDRLSPCCYSFRRSLSARDAIFSILSQKDPDTLFCFKADISNYFNSIPEDRLVLVLEEILSDDPQLLWFLKNLLLDNRCILPDGSESNEHRGAMAGIPISPFLANIYLLSMDRYFEKEDVAYYRYSDDILIFSESREKLDKAIEDLKTHIRDAGLVLNPSKLHLSCPGEPWEFLGFRYQDKKVDISDVTKEKVKGKIRRKARALLRWKTKNDAEYERAARALIRTFNKKFYNDMHEDLFTWSRWFFPVITTDESLARLDEYLLKYVRYLYSGRHYKGNYKVTYEQIKKMGFRSLKHEYYLSRKVESGEDSTDGNDT